MLSALEHRGPDEEGCFCERSVGIGIRRLAVIDVEHGHQPYRSEDGRVVAVYNGELYNYDELRDFVTSRGHRLNSRADGEVLVHLYEELGEMFVERLRGMFAIAVWDRRYERLILARDHLGQKPLFVYESGGLLAFASELKAFFQLDAFYPEINPEQIPVYLAHRFVPAPSTMLQHVTKLQPGELMVIHRHGHRHHRLYWKPPTHHLSHHHDLQYWTDRLDGLLGETVLSHLKSDVPMGIFLSGGLDSSLLAALAAPHLNRPIQAWAATFPDTYPGYDEYAWAQRVANHLGMPIRRVDVEWSITPKRIADLAFILDEPMADPTVLPLDGVARGAASQETVMLSGEGADEIFAGYAGYGEVASMQLLQRVPRALREKWAGRRWPGSGACRRSLTTMADRYRGVGFTFSPEDQQNLLQPDFIGSDRSAAILDYWAGTDNLPDLQAMQGFDVRWFLADDVLVKADRIGMHYNLEVRVPYCDYRLVELALLIPLHLRRSRRIDKRILRLVAERHLPKSVVFRKKRGFPTPLTTLLTGPLRSMVWDTLTNGSAQYRRWLRREAVEQLLRRLDAKTSLVARQVYALLMFELWVEQVVVQGRQRARRQRPAALRRRY